MKIYFDATFGEPLIVSLRGLFLYHADPKPKILHIYEIFDKNVKDDVWLSRISEKDDIIISSDLGRGGGVRLPAVCKKKNITHILLSPTLHKAKQFHKLRAIIYVWPEILKAFVAPGGTRFQISSADAAYEKFYFREK